MSGLWLQNVAFYSLQIAGLAAAGALLLRLLRIRIPKIRLICWQALLAACLALPALQPWLTTKTNSNIQISTGPSTAGDAAHRSRAMALPWTDIILVADWYRLRRSIRDPWSRILAPPAISPQFHFRARRF